MTDHTQQTNSANIGDAFDVALVGNPATGYDWDVEVSAAACQALVIIADLGAAQIGGALPGAEQIVGAPVMRRWRITAESAGRAQLIFSYRRPWETAAALKTHTVIVEIASEQRARSLPLLAR